MKHSAPRKPTLLNNKVSTTFRTSFLSLLVASSLAAPVLAAGPVQVTDTINKNYENSQNLFFDSYLHYSKFGGATTSGKFHTGVFVETNGNASLLGQNIAVEIKDLLGLVKVDLASTNPPSLRIFQASNGYLQVGGSQTENISVSVSGTPGNAAGQVMGFVAMGLKNDTAPAGNLVISGKTLNVNFDLKDETIGYAFLAQGNSKDSPNGPKITVNSDTYIHTKGESAIGIAAFSSGKIEFNKNLYLNSNSDSPSPTAIATRGNASVMINPQGDKTVQINGNIDFNFNGDTSGTPVDGHVEINLTGQESFWHGSAHVSAVGLPSQITVKDPSAPNKVLTGKDVTYEAVKKHCLENQHSLVVRLKDGAVWQPNEVSVREDADKVTGLYYAATNSLVLDNGVVNVKNNSQPVIVQKLEGKGTINIEAAKTESGLTSGQFHVGSTELDGSKVEATQFNKAEDGTHLNVNFTGVTSDDINPEEFASLATNVQALGATQAHTVKEGLILGDRTQNVDPTGAVTSTSTAENTVNQSLRDIGAMTFLGFRTAINDLDKRLGDLRSYSGENGGWVRYLGGQHRYGDRNMKLNYNGFQAGFDHRFGEFYAGAAFGYTRGSGHLHNGSSDNNNWNFGLYGGWLGEKGQFVDVIVKRHRFKNEFNLHHTSGLLSGGSYHNWATSFSAEAGWRFSCPTTGFYAEPQAELSFGRMEKGSFTTNQGVKVKQNAINSTVGRLGVAAGYTLPDGKGNAYVKASVLHDWSAKVKGSMSKGNLKKSYRDDLGGTWAEFSVGGTYNATKNISAYGEFQTSAGSPVRSPWAASVGVRYNF